VATALGTSEDGARKRVDRALNKLRRFITNKGVALSATALAGALTANAAPAAPAGLAATAGTTALAGAGGTLTATSTMVLAKGAIQMMFIAQLKTAALITAACVVVAGSGVIVAKEVLTPSAAPVVAQAEPKGLPPTPATNDTATIAWGAVTNELQAGLVPLGKGAAREDWGWVEGGSLFECPKCAGKPRKHCMDRSSAAEHRVCAVCGTAKPWSATFIAGEPMRMELHFRNLAKEVVNLYDARHGGHWQFIFTPVGGGAPWQAGWAIKDRRRAESFAQSTIQLAAGQQNAVELDLGPGWMFSDPLGRQPDIRSLPVGKYTMTATYAHPEHEQAKPCPYWHGTVTTGPVEIEIRQKVGYQVDWTASATAEYEKAVKLLGRNGFAVIRNKAEEKVFMDRLELAGIEASFVKGNRPSEPWANFERGMQVVCWRDLTAADSLRITGVQQTAGGGSGKRDKFRLDLEVKQNNANRNARAWKACCVWIPRANVLEVPGIGKDGKDEIWTADKNGRDVADGLQSCLEVKQTAIKPGDDITLTMSLRNVRPAGGEPIVVWDNNFGGYRADFYLVISPDGQSRILRRPEQKNWDKYAPRPIEIQSGRSWWLGGAENKVYFKSLKSLGLETSKEGIYTVTGYYEAEGGQGAFDEKNCLFWGGHIATPPVEVRVSASKAPAAAITEADARRIALVKATELYPEWQKHHKAATYGDVIRKATLADGFWTVEFSADNGLTGWSATIRIDAQTGKALSAEKHDGA
jgi:hypothetical protein